MKLAYRDIATTAEMDMSPMIDMVFLLLIFFLVASNFVDAKPHVDLPEAAAAVIPTDITNRLMISVHQDGSYYLDHEEVPASLDMIRERIAAEMKANDNLNVLIRADAMVRHEANKRIMKACADLGADRLIFATFEL